MSKTTKAEMKRTIYRELFHRLQDGTGVMPSPEFDDETWEQAQREVTMELESKSMQRYRRSTHG